MKNLVRVIIAATALVPIVFTTARAEKREGLEVNRTAQAINFTQTIDVSPWRSFSAQAIYSDGTPSTHSVTSGQRSSATITVGTNPSGLIGAQASITINIKSTTSISGKTVTLNGTVFTAGTDFTIGATTSTTATNLGARIDAHPDWVATVSGATVTVKYVSYGSAGNGLPAVTSSATNFGLSAATFSGGVNQTSFYLNGYEFKEGTNWKGDSSSQTIAINISTNVNADSRVNTQVSAATTSLGIVTITALASGYSNYSLSASTTGLVTSVGFPGGLASDVDIANDIITKTNHGFTTGLQVLAVTIAGTIPTGLTTGTTYFAIKLNENQYALATTSTTAAAGTKIDITGITNNSTTDMRPLALVTQAGNGFYWEASNDNSNWVSLQGVTVNGVSVSSVTYSAAGSTIWDFGTMNYRYIRPNFIAPAKGAIRLLIRIFGTKD